MIPSIPMQGRLLKPEHFQKLKGNLALVGNIQLIRECTWRKKQHKAINSLTTVQISYQESVITRKFTRPYC